MSGGPAPAVISGENAVALGTHSTWSATYLTPLYGGYSPISIKICRDTTLSGSFKRSNLTVAWPIAVLPTICAPSTWKCSCQLCWRGLNRGTICPLIQSRVARSDPLLLLHTAHASARFSC